MRIVAVVCLALIAGCHFKWPRVANVTVQQGNVITQEMVDRLKPGMTHRQVAYVMGEPVLRDPFDADRWDYVYSLQSGNAVSHQLRLSLFFDGDALARFSGDMAPSAARSEATADPLLPQSDEPITPPAG